MPHTRCLNFIKNYFFNNLYPTTKKPKNYVNLVNSSFPNKQVSSQCVPLQRLLTAKRTLNHLVRSLKTTLSITTIITEILVLFFNLLFNLFLDHKKNK